MPLAISIEVLSGQRLRPNVGRLLPTRDKVLRGRYIRAKGSAVSNDFTQENLYVSMQRPPLLLQLVAKSVLSTVDSSVLDDVTVDINPDVVERIWREWREAASEVEMVADFETLANVSPDQLDNLIQATLPPDSNVSSDASQVVAAYLAHLPGAIRREFRRPTYPSGTTIPASWTMNEPTSLHALLPQQMPWYLPGDRPWDIGDWELVELYERSPLGELWKARSPNAPEATAFLHFFLHPSIKERLFRPDDFFTESGLDRVLQFVDHRNFLKLRRLHLIADPPCLEYEFFAGAPLFRAFREWTPENLPDSQTVIDIIVDIAEAVGFLHQLDPPIVHQAIRPDNVLLRTLPSGQWQCKILHAGAGSMIPLEVLLSRQIASNSVGGSIGGPVPASSATALSIDPLIYAAPEQLREEDAGPRMDVYAIGVLWYQLLTGNLHAPRPGGSQWRKRLVERNLSGELVELLESCFEDDPSFRPKDGNVLANQLRAITQAQETAISRTRRSEIQEERSAVSRSQTTQADGQQSESQAEEPPKETPATPKPEARKARTRQRRAAMDQLFDKLEAEAPEAAKSLTNSVDMKFVLLPAGIFVMGTDPAEAGCRQNEMPQHEVSLTHDFYVAVTLVTQEQYLRVIKQNPARHNPDNGGQLDHPVENVTWENADEFCER